MLRRVKVMLTLRRGFLARKSGSLADARNHYMQAVSISRRINSKRLLVSVLKGVAQIERDSGRPAESIPVYEDAVLHCREIGDRVLLAHTIRHLGDAHQNVGELERAEDLLSRGIVALSTKSFRTQGRLGQCRSSVRSSQGAFGRDVCCR